MENEGEGYIVVTPGTLLATSEKMGEGTFIMNGKTFSKYFGIVKKTEYKTSVVPFNQKYAPQVGDMVIGQIRDFKHPFWIVDIFAPSPSFLFVKDINIREGRQDQLMNVFKPGTWIFAEVSEITDRVKLSMKNREAKILKGGRFATISPSKIPRVIGKKGSMIHLLQEKTDCHIKTGQNGLVWIEGGKCDLTIRAIQKIEKEAHIPGLTDRITDMLSKEVKENDID
ncbi:MAG: RNA-binding protein [Candidatus Aenigmarchaeota archaeon]|nr:RNA-binding protein [Candidatus Aenigmarchaeota archaeon]